MAPTRPLRPLPPPPPPATQEDVEAMKAQMRSAIDGYADTIAEMATQEWVERELAFFRHHIREEVATEFEKRSLRGRIKRFITWLRSL